MYRLIGTIFLALLLSRTFGQTVDIPQLLPSSPEPSAFMKDGVGNVNLSSGAAAAKIPLYDIKIRDFTFPLYLSYSMQGLKTDEASSRVGYGWVLNATAMINRTVRGKPDEYSGRLTSPADFTVSSSDVYNYDIGASDPTSGFDSQADEFQFNVNGYTGKFVLDNNYVPRVTSTSNITMSVQMQVTPGSTSGYIGTIVMTTPDGVTYHFGNTYEVTTTHNIIGLTVYKDRTKTSFFLDRIDLPTGEYIVFSYTPIHIRVSTGKTQILQVGNSNGTVNCSACSTLTSYTNQVNTVEYNTNYLSGITTSTGLSVALTYAARPDLSYDNRLTVFDVQGSDGTVSRELKNYQFEYYDVPGSSNASTAPSLNGRFFLTKLKEMKLNNNTTGEASHDYVFTYNALDQVPLPLAAGQDYLGYYNGRAGTDLVPPAVNSNNTIDFSFRNPNATAAADGALLSILYPTGGKQEFVYESNTVAHQYMISTAATLNVSGTGGTSSWNTYTSSSITLNFNQTVTLGAYCADAILDDGYTADPTHPTATIYLYEGSTVIASRSVLGYTPTSTNVNLLGGHTYYIKLVVRNNTEIGYGTLSYDAGNGTPSYYWQNDPVPGIRVKQVKLTDPVAQITHSKYYTYAALESLNLSSGSAPGVSFKSNAGMRIYCNNNALESDCMMDVYSSNSTNDVYNTLGSGSLMYYPTVVESDDPSFINGGTEYLYFPNDDGGNHLKMSGEDIPSLSNGQFPTLTGVVQRTRHFGSDLKTVQEEINEYETLIDLSHTVASFFVRKKWTVQISTLNWQDAFDVVQMQYGNYWNRLKSKTENTYSGGAVLTNKTDYTYGTAANILPASEATTDSKMNQVLKQMEYPNTYTNTGDNDPAVAGYAKLILKNILIPVVHERLSSGGTLIHEKRIIFNDWFHDNTIVEPQSVQLKASPSDVLHDEVLFTQYDNNGNINTFQKANDEPMTYLWDKVHELPQCEVKNATPGQVAFCNFEVLNNYGNWSLVNGGVNQSPAFTGSYSFTGSLSFTPAVAGNYVVSLWTNSSATVNGAAGTLLKQAKGWALYEWKLTGPSGITVSGTNIDDVRLFPAGSLMTSYTYQPFIGVASKSDVNNFPETYEYDGYNRLLRVRDVDNNIIRQDDYQYQVVYAAQWQATGNLRCVKDASNNNTGEQQQEQKDMNQNSVTYNQTRWVSLGNNCSACAAPANWVSTGSTQCVASTYSDGYTGEELQQQKDMSICSPTYQQTRWVSLGCQNACAPGAADWVANGSTRCVTDASGIKTGEQQQQQTDLNLCSSTYNQTRWVSVGYNCSACAASTAATWQATGTLRCATNSSSQTTGEQQAQQIDVNHCSSTYNTTRWVSLGMNCSACPMNSCTGQGQKVINCNCETGTRVNSSSVYTKITNPNGTNPPQIWVWKCTYHYVFSDCSVSQDYVEYDSSSCTVQSGCIQD